MEATQLLLILVVLVLSSVLTIIGIEVFFILREFRQSVRKMNKILDDSGVITESISKPVAELSGFLLGLKNGAALMKILGKRFEKKEEK